MTPTPVDLDRVLLTRGAVAAWSEAARRIAPFLAREPAIPDEQAELADDGWLVVFVAIGARRLLELRIPPGEWAWRELH
jgi:hypothetical protein